MKVLVYIGLFLISGTFYAQEKARDMSQQSKTKTVTVNNGEQQIENKIKVTTTEKQDVKLSEEDKNKINQNRVYDTHKQVVKTVAIDNDMDPFYDSQVKMVHFKDNGINYKFVKSSEGFTVMAKDSNNEYGKAVKSIKSNKYGFKTADFSGVGYFDSNGNFVIDYYDRATDKLVTKKFVSIK